MTAIPLPDPVVRRPEPAGMDVAALERSLPADDAEYARIVAGGGRRAEIYQQLRELAGTYGDLIRERYPQIPRRVSGYNLDALLPGVPPCT